MRKENKPIHLRKTNLYDFQKRQGTRMKEVNFNASDGKKLVCTLWDNVKNPTGVVQIIHGMDEHMRRYDRFAKFLNKNGYIAFGDDHRAHGKTAGDISRIGQTGDETDLFARTVSDEIEILKYLKKKYSLPVFLFGHSYGSFITQRIMEDTKLCTAGVCLSGSAKYPMGFLLIAVFSAWVGMRLFGANAAARFIEFFSPIRGKMNGSSRLTRDEKQAAEHDADPMHAKYFSYGFYYSLFKNLMKLTGHACEKTPLLIISGSRDLVSMNSRLAMSLYKTYQAHNLQNLTIIIYPEARHELLMEINYSDVQRDILDFFNSVNRK